MAEIHTQGLRRYSNQHQPSRSCLGPWMNCTQSPSRLRCVYGRQRERTPGGWSDHDAAAKPLGLGPQHFSFFDVTARTARGTSGNPVASRNLDERDRVGPVD